MFITIPLMVIFASIFANYGCLGYTVYCEIGGEACLDFVKNNSLFTYAIKKNSSLVCLSTDRTTIYTFAPWKGKVNCTISSTKMSMCLGNFQSGDGGIFSLHKGSTDSSVLLSSIALVKATPVTSVDVELSPINVSAEQQMNLTCTTSYCLPPANITWFNVSTDITSLSTSRRESSQNLQRTISLLKINPSKSDNGKSMYCEASNLPGRIVNATVIINVLYKPEVSSDPSGPYVIVKGKTLNITCTIVEANPNTNIAWQWRINDTNVNVTGPNYIVSNVQRDKSGTYSCEARNSVGTSVAALTIVDVQYAPEVTTREKTPYKVIVGETAILKCVVIAANPNEIITWKWFKNVSKVLHNQSIYTINNIMRSDSGSYSCTARNSIGTSELATINVDVLYKPEVESLTTSPYIITEGRTATLECKVKDANPFTNITWTWLKTDSENKILDSQSTYTISNISRSDAGLYSCYANNSAGASEAATIDINVQYKPRIVHKPTTTVNESDEIILTRTIVSNPLSDVYWINGTTVLDMQTSVEIAKFTRRTALCTDTTNLTLVAINGVEENATANVELIVNCKPQSYKTNFTLGVTDTTGIDFSTIIIAYPEPVIELEYENGTVPDQMMRSIFSNAVNNFTIRIRQAYVNQSDFGVYHLKVRNLFGEITMIVNVIPQRKPNMPKNIKIVCEATRAEVKWKSSFNGGDSQLFTVFASNGQQSDKISDKGENLIHSTFVQHLQPSTMYVFYVSGQNSHGRISSENISCTTLSESSDKLPIIVGSAAAGGLTIAIVVIVVILLFRRYTSTEDQAGKSQRFENDLVENESVDDDGLKDNILYVSADQRENEKHEVAVYAAVNKKDPTSNNNCNIYAEVKKNETKGVKEGANQSDVKPKKGFFKKDGKVKKEKRQKRKQEVADVYENSDDIAMTTNPDNVYSNANHNNDSAKQQRGYKNKDGLLYVEVKFDTKTEESNPVIHGDDEKTDYATVEFPMPSSSHDRE